MDIYTLIGYAGAVLTGLVLGLLGGGGALFSIPVLVYIFHLPASKATAYSLFLVAVTASVGAVQNVRKQLVDFKAVLYYGVPSVIAVYIVRRFVMPNLPDVFFTIGDYPVDKNHFILFILSVVMFSAGYKMSKAPLVQEGETQVNRPVDFFRLSIYAILIGSFLGLVGAGGGFLMVPALVLFGQVPMKKALGTSLVLVAVNSFVGFSGDVNANVEMDWKFLFYFCALSIAGLFAGSALQQVINSHQLKKYFGWMMMLVGVGILIKEFVVRG